MTIKPKLRIEAFVNFFGKVLLVICLNSGSLLSISIAASNEVKAASIAKQAQSELNAIRRQVGLVDLKVNVKLMKAAAQQVSRMASSGTMSHRLGGSLRSRVRSAGFTGVAAENLGGGYSSARSIVIAWMKSPSHRRNILVGAYTCFGVATGPNTSGKGKHKNYWALMLGRC